MVVGIVVTNWLCIEIASRAFGKSGFAAVPVVRGGTAAVTFVLTVGWWVLSNQWDGRFTVSRRTLAGAFLLVVWLCLGLYYGSPLGYVASDTFFLFHSLLLLLIFHTYFSRAAIYSAHVQSVQGAFDQWFDVPLWLVGVGLSGFFIPKLQLPPSISLVIVVGAIASLIRGRHTLASVLGGILMMMYATSGNRAFLLAVIVALLCGLFIAKRTRSLQVVFSVVLLGGIFSVSSEAAGPNITRQRERVLEVWNSIVDVQNGARIEDLPVPLYQRVYEAQLVSEKMSEGGLVPLLFGYGAGASLDMSKSNDPSVAEASLLGIERVHNIHLLPYMIAFRYGLIGLVLLILLTYGIARQLVNFRRYYVARGTHLGVLMACSYVLGWLAFSVPAGGFIFEDPLMFICIGAIWAAAKTDLYATHASAETG